MELGSGGLIRSRKGCDTCRVRHVKCDEGKPTCARCQRDGRRCDGYNTSRNRPLKNAQFGKHAPPSSPSTLPVLPSFEDPRQREFFAYYVTCISDASSLYFGANFWARRVLQLSLSEASIKYALCSLSALQRSSTVSDPKNLHYTSTELRNYALQQYNHAVRHTRTLLAESSDGSTDKLIKGLVACALFVCYESFTGNHEVSYMHLRNGLQIIGRECRKQRHSVIPKDIIQVFRRLDLQVKSIGNSKVPYPDQSCAEPMGLIDELPTSFSSFEDSMDVIHRLVTWILQRSVRLGPCPTNLEDIETAKKVLEKWYQEIEILSKKTKIPHNLQRSISLLKMHQIIMTVIIGIVVYRQETMHDIYLYKYQQIVDLAEGLVQDIQTSGDQFFSFDVGVILPLFWVGTKCRESRVRRRAVEILASMNHQEGIWKSTTAAKVAQFVIDIEEEGLPEGFHQDQVSETARVHWVTTVEDDVKGECRMSCLLRSNIDDVSWYTKAGKFTKADCFYH